MCVCVYIYLHLYKYEYQSLVPVVQRILVRSQTTVCVSFFRFVLLSLVQHTTTVFFSNSKQISKNKIIKTDMKNPNYVKLLFHLQTTQKK